MSGIVVMGATGGCGTTTIACALALRLSGGSRVPVLIDAGVHGGGPAAAWGLAPARALDDLLPLGHDITAAHVEHVLHRHARGVDVIGGCASPVGAMAWTGPAATALAGHVADRGAWVADAGFADAPVAVALLARARRTVLVVPRTAQGAARARMALERVGDRPLAIVAGHVPGGDSVSPRGLARAVGGRAVIALGRDDRAAIDVAEARLPRGRRLARVVDQLLEPA